MVIYFISVTAKLGSYLRINKDESSSAAANYQVSKFYCRL